jgi:hypothetical protein
MARSIVLVKLIKGKNCQVQATFKASTCALFSQIAALEDTQNRIVFQKFLELEY